MSEQEAEKRGYAKGYAAGRRRLEADLSREQAAAEREEWRRRVFLAALPACISASGWTDGEGKPINTLMARIKLAILAADTAVKRI